MIQQVIQGTDYGPITVVVQDLTGTPIPLANIDDYQIYVYIKRDQQKVNLFTYKKTPLANTTDLPIIIIDANTQGFILNRTQTASMQCGEVYFESVVKLPASSDFISSQSKIGNDALLCCIVPSPNPKGLI